MGKIVSRIGNKPRDDIQKYLLKAMEDEHGIDRVTAGTCITATMHELGSIIDGISTYEVHEVYKINKKLGDLIRALFYVTGARNGPQENN